jgi:hypothetical protein
VTQNPHQGSKPFAGVTALIGSIHNHRKTNCMNSNPARTIFGCAVYSVHRFNYWLNAAATELIAKYV